MKLSLKTINLKQKQKRKTKTNIMNYKEIEEIKKEMYLSGNLQREAVFQCYSENIFTYHLYDNDDENDAFWELSIINTDADFFDKEKVCDLLDLQNTQYLSVRYYFVRDKLKGGGYELFEGSLKVFKLADYVEDKSNLN
jgi:hypothetical protein